MGLAVRGRSASRHGALGPVLVDWASRLAGGTARAVRVRLAPLAAWARSSPYLRKWLLLGSAIGVIAGLGAVVFYSALGAATHLLLGDLAGYRIPTPFGEGNSPGSSYFARPWALPLVLGLGGLLSGVLVFSLAPEAEGHGTDAAIEAVHRNPRMIRARVVLVKIVASALTIGSGGSGGREGPTAQISAGFGSLLARALDLSPEDGRVAVSVGIGSGIGAIFGAPLGGAVLAADIVYRDDFEVQALIPGLIASIISYTVFGLIETFSPLFGYVAATYQFHQPLQLAWFALIGLVAGPVGLIYARAFYGTTAIFRRLPANRMLKPALAGLLVGLMALGLPQVLGTGYGWVQRALGPALASMPLWVVLVLPLARIVATSLSIGSGGSGGIFGPGMVIGAFTGAALWRLLEPVAPGVPASPAPFVGVGMMACFGAIARAPLAVMLMVAEMTGSLTLLAPAMVAVGLSYLSVSRTDETIYRSQLKNRVATPAQRLQFGLPMVGGLSVAEALVAPRVVLDEGEPIEEALARLARARVPGSPVTDHEGRFIGTVSKDLLAAEVASRPGANVGRLADPTTPTVQLTDSLEIALEALSGEDGWAPVLGPGRHLEGVLATSDIVRAYGKAIGARMGKLKALPASTSVLNGRVAPGSPLAGHALREPLLPDGCIVVSVQRGSALLFPDGSTVLQPGDLVSVLARPGAVEPVTRLLAGPSQVPLAPGSAPARGANQPLAPRAEPPTMDGQ